MAGESADALAGLRVLDLASGAAAYAGRLLADFGAQVLKVEPPGGEIGRRTAPFTDSGASLFFWHYNLGKNSTIIAPAPGALDALLAEADVVITGGPELPFGPASALGGPDTLIRAELAGFGRGPRENWTASELIAQAAGGLMFVTGEADREPLRVYGEQAHHLASHYLIQGIMLALRARERTGQGQNLEVTLQEAMASSVEQVEVLYSYEHRIPQRMGDLHWTRGWAIFRCLDGHVTMCWNRNWDHLLALLAADDKAADFDDPRYEDDLDFRDAQVPHIRDVLQTFAAAHTRDEIFSHGQLFRLPWARLNRPDEVLEDPQLRERGFFVPLPGPDGTMLPASGAPGVLSRTPWRPRRSAPPLGSAAAEWPKRSAVQPVRAPLEPAAAGKPALDGIRVLDFTWVLAGPFGTRILGDHGADVMKIQTDRRMVGYVSNGYFTTFNRNKRGISLDLDHTEARELVRRLVAVSDVVVDNFSARVMRGWGLDDDTLRSLRPDLIIAHLSGMGHTGPYTNQVSYGPTAQALSGLSTLTGYRGGEPVGLGLSYSDHAAGISLASAVLAALAYRSRTGEGQVIDVSQFETTTALMGTAYLEAALGRRLRPTGNSGASTSPGPTGVYRCKGHERWLAVEVTTDEAQQALRDLLGDPANLEYELECWLLEQTAEAAMRKLQSLGVAAALVADAADLVDRDEGLRARGYWVRANHPTLGVTPFDGPPAHLSRTPAPPPEPSPLIGQHNNEIYGELLGIDAATLADYVARGILK